MRRPLVNALLSLTFLAAPAMLLVQHPITLQAQQRTLRLILKDGSYQSVVKYEIQGDRVHYLSAERFEWEDIPSSLIDWDATKKYEADFNSGKLHKAQEETPEEKEEREKEEANSPQIAPGLHLPGTGGVFLLDQYQGKARTGGDRAKRQRAEQEHQQERIAGHNQSDSQLQTAV